MGKLHEDERRTEKNMGERANFAKMKRTQRANEVNSYYK